jgi:hypothetical protein
MQLYAEFSICEQLHTGFYSSLPWQHRPRWERIHWLAYFGLKNLIEAYQTDQDKYEAVGVSLDDWIVSDSDRRKKDQQQAQRIHRMKIKG